MNDDGSSLIEVLIAAALTVLALGLVAAPVLPTVLAQADAVVPDARPVELDLAADVVARAVRAARPGPEAPPVRVVADGGLAVRFGPDDADGATFVLDSGALHVNAQQPTGRGPRLPVGVLVDGLGTDGVGFALLDASDRTIPADERSDIDAVLVTLERDGHRVERRVRLRSQRPLDGPAR